MENIEVFRSSEGRRIYALPVEAFPGFVVNLYLVESGDHLLLVDCGSGTDECQRQIESRFDQLRSEFGSPIQISDVTTILITHGHIDHFGGLRWAKEASEAPVAVHILDRRVLSNYEERVIVASKAVEAFLERAGVDPEKRDGLMAMYLFAKGRYRSTPVEWLLEEGAPAPGGLEVHHVPGHCPGQVCLRVDDILLTADHILARITPNQAPEAITQYTGLGHYFSSLEKISKLDGIRLGLGGHEGPIHDLKTRISDIRGLHLNRLDKVMEICQTPRNVAEISLELFGPRKSYHVLLALIETGAHVEYLYQRGELCASNLEEIEKTSNPVIKYLRC